MTNQPSPKPDSKDEALKQLASHLKGITIALTKCYPCAEKGVEEQITSHILGLFWSLVQVQTELMVSESVNDKGQG